MSDLQLGPWNPPKRDHDWQVRGFEAYQSAGQRDFLGAITTGGGKTQFGLKVAHDSLRRGESKQVLVIVPTAHLRAQWMSSANGVGIQLQTDFRNDHGRIGRDFHGTVVTYALVYMNPEVYRALCRDDTFVLMDEPHHLGGNLGWPSAARHGFEPAKARLLLSGTPWRHDNEPIPFVRYDENDESVADFKYSYGEALEDGVVRYVLFPSYEGEMTWVSGAEEFTKTFADPVPERERSRLLSTALDVNGEWLPRVIEEANEELQNIRRHHYAQAGALITCKDQRHAKAVTRLIQKRLGIQPEIAVSEDPEASQVIARFARSDAPWLVSVQMVTEGVDIPRLMTGVYATNRGTERNFHQFVGRLLRQVEGVTAPATVRIPAIKTYKVWVDRFREMRDHALKPKGPPPPPPPPPGPVRVFIPLGSSADPHDVWTPDREEISQTEVRAAQELMSRSGLAGVLAPSVMAKILRSYDSASKVGDDGPIRSETVPQGQSNDERKQQLRRVVDGLARRYALATCADRNNPERVRERFQDVYRLLAEAVGGVYRKDLDIQQLETQWRLLAGWLERAGEGGPGDGG